MEDPYNIKLPLFEGPLDLLLHLIRENKVDIYDIPIALITKQYLEYLALMKEMNLEIAGEFIVMAATLIHIKSRMLLPIEETADTDEPEDPRYELVQKLLAYKAFKDAALGLKEKEEEIELVRHRAPMPDDEYQDDSPELMLFDLNIFDLINSFKQVMDRAPEEIAEITKETLTVKDKMSLITEAVQRTDAMRFVDLFEGDVIRAHFIVTFIALLELLRLGIIHAYQEKEFGTIWIIRPEDVPLPVQEETTSQPAP